MLKFKQHISIALTVAMLIGMLWQTFTVVHFYINQDEIIEAHCVNKDKPDLNCKGQCHLKQQLETTTSLEQEESKTTRSSKTSILLFVFAETHDEASCACIEHHKNNYPNELYETNNYIPEVFTPPKFV
jgi:hypothetical protein